MAPRHSDQNSRDRLAVRWSVWLLAGVLLGLGLGFAAGLAKPRLRG